MHTPFLIRSLKSFDGGTSALVKIYQPDRLKAFEQLFKENSSFSVRGAGLSYPALSFSQECNTTNNSSALHRNVKELRIPETGLIDLSSFNRILSFDPEHGTMEVEAGITLGQLASFSLQKGWFLKTQPGHPSIAIGGCIGSDVHGKNQFSDGNFRNQISFLRLFHPKHGHIKCSSQENPEIFELTCGGFGLTGVIVSAGLKLQKIPASTLNAKTIELKNFDELPAMLNTLSPQADMIYSWHDLASPHNFGRGFIKVGQFHEGSNLQYGKESALIGEKFSFKKLTAEERGKRLTFSLFGKPTAKLLNWGYRHKELTFSSKDENLLSFMFPIAHKTSYYDFFGPAGFFESQVLVPAPQFLALVRELKSGIEKFDICITLASCKIFSGKQSLLRFDGSGIVLAINLPRNSKAYDFLKWWDSAVIGHSAIPSLVKDSRLSRAVVEKTYPELELFSQGLRKWDPNLMFRNSLSERLQL